MTGAQAKALAAEALELALRAAATAEREACVRRLDDAAEEYDHDGNATSARIARELAMLLRSGR